MEGFPQLHEHGRGGWNRFGGAVWGLVALEFDRTDFKGNGGAVGGASRATAASSR